MHTYQMAQTGKVGPFVARHGTIGFQCACGFTAYCRTLAALETTMTDHQDSPHCPAFASQREAEKELGIE